MLEVIAAVQHAIWAHWMKYLFSVCSEADDGSMLIPKDKVDRWQRQMWTPYTDLTEREKESDRDQARKVLLAIIDKEGDETIPYLVSYRYSDPVGTHEIVEVIQSTKPLATAHDIRKMIEYIGTAERSDIFIYNIVRLPI